MTTTHGNRSSSLRLSCEEDFSRPLLTGDTLLDSPSISILGGGGGEPITTLLLPTPLLNLKQSFYLHPKFAEEYPFTPPPPPPPPKDANSSDLLLSFSPKDPISLSPRFAPPRFSNRLRSLVENRPKPLRVYAAPPPMGEKQRLLRHAMGCRTPQGLSAITVESADDEDLERGRGWMKGGIERTRRVDPRLWLLVSLIGCLGAAVTGAALFVSVWGEEEI